MKISELISKLQYAQHVSGDLEVVIVSSLSLTDSVWNDILRGDQKPDKIKISFDDNRIEILSKNLPYISD